MVIDCQDELPFDCREDLRKPCIILVTHLVTVPGSLIIWWIEIEYCFSAVIPPDGVVICPFLDGDMPEPVMYP
jgi:hypothetical protein